MTRFADVEAEILEMGRLPYSEWLRLMKKLHGETLVFLIRLIDRDTGDVAGPFLMELGKRTIRISTETAQGCDEIDLIVSAVSLEIMERVLERPSEQPDFLEASFASAVRSRTVDAIRKNNNSPTRGHRAAYVPNVADVESMDEEEELEPLEFVRDMRPSPEAVHLNAGQEALPDEVVERLYAAVKGPMDAEALMLVHFFGFSYEEAAQVLGVTERRIKYLLVKGLRAIREELGVEI
jgi:DNA-directed RNA polymerase specialized sigma24 family protein